MDKTAIRLQDLRVGRGLTQEQTASLLEIDPRRWKSYEYGDRNMPLHILKATAGLFNVTSDYLLGLSDEMQPQAKEFQESTGLSESTIANISKHKNQYEMISCINQFLSSDEFINAITNIVYAKAPYNPLESRKENAQNSVEQGIEKAKVAVGKKKIKGNKLTLTGKDINEYELWQASQCINKLIDRIVKGDNDNGTC